MWTQGGAGGVEISQEIVTGVCTAVCKAHSSWEPAGHHREPSSVMTWRDGMERVGRETLEGGAYVHLQLTHFIVQRRLVKCGRATILQLKKKSSHITFKAKERQFISNLGLSGVPRRMRLIGNEDCPENHGGCEQSPLHSFLGCVQPGALLTRRPWGENIASSYGRAFLSLSLSLSPLSGSRNTGLSENV